MKSTTGPRSPLRIPYCRVPYPELSDVSTTAISEDVMNWSLDTVTNVEWIPASNLISSLTDSAKYNLESCHHQLLSDSSSYFQAHQLWNQSVAVSERSPLVLPHGNNANTTTSTTENGLMIINEVKTKERKKKRKSILKFVSKVRRRLNTSLSSPEFPQAIKMSRAEVQATLQDSTKCHYKMPLIQAAVSTTIVNEMLSSKVMEVRSKLLNELENAKRDLQKLYDQKEILKAQKSRFIPMLQSQEITHQKLIESRDQLQQEMQWHLLQSMNAKDAAAKVEELQTEWAAKERQLQRALESVEQVKTALNAASRDHELSLMATSHVQRRVRNVRQECESLNWSCGDMKHLVEQLLQEMCKLHGRILVGVKFNGSPEDSGVIFLGHDQFYLKNSDPPKPIQVPFLLQPGATLRSAFAETLEPHLEGVLAGHPFCVILYGSRHSGKTETLLGSCEDSQNEENTGKEGVLQLTLEFLLGPEKEKRPSGQARTVSMSLIHVSTTKPYMIDLVAQKPMTLNGVDSLEKLVRSTQRWDATEPSEVLQLMHKVRQSLEKLRHCEPPMSHVAVVLTVKTSSHQTHVCFMDTIGVLDPLEIHGLAAERLDWEKAIHRDLEELRAILEKFQKGAFYQLQKMLHRACCQNGSLSQVLLLALLAAQQSSTASSLLLVTCPVAQRLLPLTRDIMEFAHTLQTNARRRREKTKTTSSGLNQTIHWQFGDSIENMDKYL